MEFGCGKLERLQLTKREFKKLKFNLHFMVQDLENMELPETWNFNPIEKSLPFLKMRVEWLWVLWRLGLH